ncbi:MAG TPA: TonB family protein [Vicinamibacterales bacterium]|nr:TonB family protein [Vicinamibacterales bacterium]
MTSLRLSEAGGATAAEVASTHLFATAARVGERYRARGWPYAASAVFHGVALMSIVVLARALTVTPPPPAPTPLDETRTVAHAFVFGGVHESRRPRSVRATSRPADIPVVIPGDSIPLPPTRGESRAEASPTIDEKPLQRAALDPPVPVVASEPRMTARYGDPKEAGFGSATPVARGLPSAEVRPGGLGEGNVRDGRAVPSMFQASAGFDGTGDGDAASPPHIQQPLPIPTYPSEARNRRLQGVVVLEVMLDSLGRAHVRGVLSDPIGFGIEEAATNAAERLKFTPARQGGRPVDAIVQVKVTFTLTGSVETAVRGGA